MICRALERLNITDGELTVLLVGNRKIKKLNEQYFGKSNPTNVISFPYLDEPAIRTGVIEGDVVVSVDFVLSDGADWLGDLERVFFYVLHGILHVAGMDHERSEAEAEEMRDLERKIFHEITGEKVD